MCNGGGACVVVVVVVVVSFCVYGCVHVLLVYTFMSSSSGI